jgi:very-short-patch-repair endonuclease
MRSLGHAVRGGRTLALLKLYGQMAVQMLQKLERELWALVGRQHGVVSRSQLTALGLGPSRIDRWLAAGRLHPIWRGVYAVGRPQLDRLGHWMGAVLACGDGAVLSHETAAALWEIREDHGSLIHVSVAGRTLRRRAGIAAHRRDCLRHDDVTRRRGIPVTTPICTLIDIAAGLSLAQRERAVSEADKLDLVDPETLRSGLQERQGRRGAPALRAALDRHTFSLTDSELEREFLRIVRDAGLAKPVTQAIVNGFRVDFYWPELGLIVETDGLRYHRTAQQQTRDRVRDQVHTAAGLTVLRFTRAQVRFDRARVAQTLAAVASRLAAQQNF